MAFDRSELCNATFYLGNICSKCYLPAASSFHTTINKCILQKLHISYHIQYSLCHLALYCQTHTLALCEGCVRLFHMMIRGSGTESVMDLCGKTLAPLM